MNTYALSNEADRDVEMIAVDTISRWGGDQADRYLSGLHGAFEMLARFPELGRPADHLRAGYRRVEHASHSIFYLRRPESILIIRVLYIRMRPDRQL